MTALLIGLAALGYVTVAGITIAICRRFEMFDGADDMLMLFWPLLWIAGAVGGIVWLALVVSRRIGEAVVGRAIGLWRGRRLPRAVARYRD